MILTIKSLMQTPIQMDSMYSQDFITATFVLGIVFLDAVWLAVILRQG